MGTLPVIDVRTVNFRYDEVEDRLFLDCSGADAAQTLLLTRRITRRLLQLFANALASSSLAVRRAPVAARHEVIALEHFSSLAVEPPPAETGAGAAPVEPPPQLPPALVYKAEIETEPVLFRLRFHSTERPLASLALTRSDFHKLLSTLDHWSVAAEWDIHAEAGWLNGAQELATSGAGRDAS